MDTADLHFSFVRNILMSLWESRSKNIIKFLPEHKMPVAVTNGLALPVSGMPSVPPTFITTQFITVCMLLTINISQFEVHMRMCVYLHTYTCMHKYEKKIYKALNQGNAKNMGSIALVYLHILSILVFIVICLPLSIHSSFSR